LPPNFLKNTAIENIKNTDIFGNTSRIGLKKALPYNRIKKKVKREYTPPAYIGQMLYIKPSYIVSLPEYENSNKGRSLVFIKNQDNLRNNAHGGQISYKADKKLRASVNWLCLAAEPKKVYQKSTNKTFDFKINFITLTLPDTKETIKDYDFKTKLLNPFLVYCRKYFGLRNYVWKLEFQKNGKIHIHLTTDTFIHWEKLRKAWNKILGSNEYLIDFYKKFGHSNPNSTDVHSVRKIKNIAAYICKYMGKSDTQLKKIKGRIWGCNYELSRALDCKVFVDRDHCSMHLKSLMQPKIKYDKIYTIDKFTEQRTERGDIFFPTARNWIEDILGPVKESFTEKINSIRNIAHDGTMFTELNVV